jgi:hypothetical protein
MSKPETQRKTTRKRRKGEKETPFFTAIQPAKGARPKVVPRKKWQSQVNLFV